MVELSELETGEPFLMPATDSLLYIRKCIGATMKLLCYLLARRLKQMNIAKTECAARFGNQPENAFPVASEIWFMVLSICC